MSAVLSDVQLELMRIARVISEDGLRRFRDVLQKNSLEIEPSTTLMRDFGLLAVPEERGGDGGGLVDLLVFVEGLGRNLEPNRFVHHAAALQVMVEAGLNIGVLGTMQDVVLAVFDAPGQVWGDWHLDMSKDVVRGWKLAVPFATTRSLAVVVGANDQVGVIGIASTKPRTGIDPSLSLADIELAGRPLDRADGGSNALLRGQLVLAASVLGASRGALLAAAEYAKTRHQFGRPIGSFQGIAHMLADAYVDVEAAWSLLLYAGWSYEVSDGNRRSAAQSAIAKSISTALYASERALQVHGGIGVTWEADPHLYIRRILAVNSQLGQATHHYRQVGSRLATSGSTITVASSGLFSPT